jgi:hypothetical protein
MKEACQIMARLYDLESQVDQLELTFLGMAEILQVNVKALVTYGTLCKGCWAGVEIGLDAMKRLPAT